MCSLMLANHYQGLQKSNISVCEIVASIPSPNENLHNFLLLSDHCFVLIVLNPNNYPRLLYPKLSASALSSAPQDEDKDERERLVKRVVHLPESECQSLNCSHVKKK